jgi:hypothetical protein
MCLTLFCFSKWKDSGNNKNATALRLLNNADEALMFLNPGEAAPHRRRGIR